MAGDRLQAYGGPAYGNSTEQLNNDFAAESKRPETGAGRWRRKKLLWLIVAFFVILIAAGVAIGVLASQGVIRVGRASGPSSQSANSSGSDSESESGTTGIPDATQGSSPTATSDDSSASASATSSTSSSSSSKPTSTSCPKASDIPKDARGTVLDSSAWLDMDGFNCTYTDETIGNLSTMGLFSEWDDSARANPNVPALNKPWGSYEKKPFRGVNVGGWLSIEPFISPSLFEYPSDSGVVDEYTLCKHLGDKAAEVIEEHYATFITEQDFKDIAAAGLDHVRIPFSYWAVETFDDDPYVPKLAWRYLLRGIEWARKYGLRVKLDLHGLPGSQNGWNHSGRSGEINFLNGSKGKTNAERALAIHDKMSAFFAQDRYKNVIAFYGLANEPGHKLDQKDVEKWTLDAYDIIKANEVKAPQVFSEGLRGLSFWEGKFPDHNDNMVIDAHQYTIFDNNLIALGHEERITFACKEFTQQSVNSIKGFGPTMVGEWSQAHTDCVRHLNGVGGGNRWTGTWFDTDGPSCPTKDKKCDCSVSNDASKFSTAYKRFIKTWAIAQMDAYEKSWGWFYWTWKTESAPLWSYQAGLKGGFMPEKAFERDWDCSKPIPDFGDLPEYY